MQKTILNTLPDSSKSNKRQILSDLWKSNQIPESELLINLGLFQRSSLCAKFLYFNELYQMIAPTQGVIMEFGVWWGQTIVQLENLRAIYEPYNYTRKIIGFDTFSGYPKPQAEDGNSTLMVQGQYDVGSEYLEKLRELIKYHEHENKRNEIGSCELVKGDAPVELENYLKENTHTIISLAIFDMQLYEPTKDCLRLIRPFLTKGSVIAFDEINNEDFPGATIALREEYGLDTFEIKRSIYLPDRSYIIIK